MLLTGRLLLCTENPRLYRAAFIFGIKVQIFSHLNSKKTTTEKKNTGPHPAR